MREDEQRSRRQKLVSLIESTEDFDELTVSLAVKVTASGLREPAKHSLRKLIATKAGVPLRSILQDAKPHRSLPSGKEENHLHIARRVVKSYGLGNLLFALQQLWQWSKEGVWRRLDDRAVKQRIHAAVKGYLTKGMVESVLDLVKTDIFRQNHRFNVETHAINCRDGELHFADGKWTLKKHEREHYRTTQIPVTYDPAAKAPRFEQFLEEVFQSDSDAELKARIVYEGLGYSLLPTCRYEKFFILIGGGANG